MGCIVVMYKHLLFSPLFHIINRRHYFRDRGLKLNIANIYDGDTICYKLPFSPALIKYIQSFIVKPGVCKINHVYISLQLFYEKTLLCILKLRPTHFNICHAHVKKIKSFSDIPVQMNEATAKAKATRDTAIHCFGCNFSRCPFSW